MSDDKDEAARPRLQEKERTPEVTSPFTESVPRGYLVPIRSTMPVLGRERQNRRGFMLPAGQDHCHSRPFHQVPLAAEPPPAVAGRPRAASFLLMPDYILRGQFVLRCEGETLETAATLSQQEAAVVGSRQFNVAVRPADESHAEGDVVLTMQNGILAASIYLDRAKLQTLIATLRRDICPSLAVYFDCLIKGDGFGKAGGRIGKEGMALPAGVPVKARLADLRTACPRLKGPRLALLPKARGT